MITTLSYIMTTYNKLSYLKITLPNLIDACKEDEEIVIVDGGSTDGTIEFLKELHQQKKIHQFVSEKDFGEAHGTNKAILMANGVLLKIITDDDIFDFKVIAFCKNYLLENKNIDMCGTDGISVSLLHAKNNFIPTTYRDGFLEWKKTKSPFLFCGLSYMIRKSSVSRLGLLSTEYKIIDFEYSARTSAIGANIAFCNAYSFANIVGLDSNSTKFFNSIKSEKKKLKYLYPTISNLNYTLEIKHVLKTKVKKIIGHNTKVITNNSISYQELVNESITALKNNNNSIKLDFL